MRPEGRGGIGFAMEMGDGRWDMLEDGVSGPKAVDQACELFSDSDDLIPQIWAILRVLRVIVLDDIK